MVRFSRSQQVVATDIGAGVALLNLTNNTYFSLNDVGAFLWNLLDVPKSREDLVEAVVVAYEVAPEICTADIDQLLSELKEAALVFDEQQSTR